MRLSGFFREMAEQICNQYESRTVSEHSPGLHVSIFCLGPQGSTPQQFCVVSKKCCNLVVEKGIISYQLITRVPHRIFMVNPRGRSQSLGKKSQSNQMRVAGAITPHVHLAFIHSSRPMFTFHSLPHHAPYSPGIPPSLPMPTLHFFSCLASKGQLALKLWENRMQ